jgi:hypothetical protein
MGAFQVAGLGHIPDHNRLFVFGKLKKMTRQVLGFSAIAKCVGRLNRTAV